MTKLYSADNESFRYLTVGEVIDELDSEGRLSIGEIYYEVDAEEVDIAALLTAETLLAAADEALCDDIGEAAADAYAVSADALAELNAAIATWAAQHLKRTPRFRCVGGVREVRVTLDDLADAPDERTACRRCGASLPVELGASEDADWWECYCEECDLAIGGVSPRQPRAVSDEPTES